MEKIYLYSAAMLLVVAMPCIMTLCFGVNKAVGAEGNTAVVKRYFKAIDTRDAGAMSGLFTKEARQNFVGSDPIVGVKAIQAKLDLALSQIESMKTEFVNFVSEGDWVLAHVKHTAVFKAGGAFKNRDGITPPVVVLPGPKNVGWEAMATFRLEDGLIAEEIIVRDELAIVQQLGSITLK